ncbi:hypothetical protein EVAR_19015_1 [Eumeta japonica]|uniref:Uncharacterized protein n=1 Tax=Eumeta variegata TaxID=151549 RepID=A0A4C1V9L4_EUMVA|nr:hypothetical protein EVAR_19015_1 [Eumeta japonica]
MYKPLEEREEFWADVRDILVKCDRNERMILEVFPERPAIKYFNPEYLKWINFTIKRYGRQSIYYLNVEGHLKHAWGNNVTGEYHLMNLTVDMGSFKSVWPFEKCRLEFTIKSENNITIGIGESHGRSFSGILGDQIGYEIIAIGGKKILNRKPGTRRRSVRQRPPK